MFNFIKKISIYGFLGAALAIAVNFTFISLVEDKVYISFEGYETQTNLVMLQRESGNYDTLFVGDSRIKRGIVPEHFDDVAGTRSLNMAIAGMTSPRLNPYLEYLLHNHDEGLENIFISFVSYHHLGQNFASDPILSATSPLDVRTMRDIVRIDALDEQMAARMRAEYLQSFLYKYLGFGFDRYVEKWLGRFSGGEVLPINPDPFFLKYGGFLPFDEHMDSLREKGEAGAATLADMEQRHASLEAAYEFNYESFKKGFSWVERLDFSQVPMFDRTRETLELADAFRAKGIDVYFVIPPRVISSVLVTMYSQMQYYKDYPILNFADPLAYPAIYTKEHSFDISHLNTPGAEVFSRIMAEEFLKIQQMP